MIIVSQDLFACCGGFIRWPFCVLSFTWLIFEARIGVVMCERQHSRRRRRRRHFSPENLKYN